MIRSACPVAIVLLALVAGCDARSAPPKKTTTLSSGTVDAAKKVEPARPVPPAPAIAPGFELARMSAELRTDKAGRSRLYVFFDATPEKPTSEGFVLARATCRVGTELVGDAVRARGVELLAGTGETFETDAAFWSEDGISGAPTACTLSFESRANVIDPPRMLGTYCFKPPFDVQSGACAECPLKGT